MMDRRFTAAANVIAGFVALWSEGVTSVPAFVRAMTCDIEAHGYRCPPRVPCCC